MEEAKTIVEMLNAPPLEFGICSVLEFCQKSSTQLRQLLYQVLCAIYPPQQRNDDASEATTSWMMEVLRVLNYRSSIDGITLREGIANGSTDVIYKLLSWLLSQIPTLQKRAYLSRFLVDVDIPPELLLEEDMNMLHAQFNGLREQFKATHRELDRLRQSEMERDPNKVREQVQELEAERDHLQTKILKAKGKLQDVEKVEAMLEVVGQLKAQRMEEENLSEALKEQTEALARSLDEHQKATSNLQEMQNYAAAAATNPDFIHKILNENSILRYNAEEKLPKELEAKQLRLSALHEVLNGSDQSDGIADIQVKLVAVNDEIKRLKRKNGDGASKGDVLQWQQAQMGTIIANKTRAALDKLAAMTSSRDLFMKELDEKNIAIEKVKATVRRGEDFKLYVDLLRQKSATYKKAKKEIDGLAAEYGVLLRTQQLLEQQNRSAASNCPAHEEESRSEVPDHVEMKRDGKSLKKSIIEVDASIKELRHKLAPQVKELKLLRTELQRLEVEHAEKKQHHNDMKGLFERKVAKLEADLSASSKEFDLENQALKDNVAAIEKLQESLMELNLEKQDGSVSAKLNAKIEQQQEMMNGLQQKHQKLKETENASVVQMAMMKDLLTLLAAKLTFYSSGSKPAIFSTATSLETLDNTVSERIGLPKAKAFACLGLTSKDFDPKF